VLRSIVGNDDFFFFFFWVFFNSIGKFGSWANNASYSLHHVEGSRYIFASNLCLIPAASGQSRNICAQL